LGLIKLQEDVEFYYFYFLQEVDVEVAYQSPALLNVLVVVVLSLLLLVLLLLLELVLFCITQSGNQPFGESSDPSACFSLPNVQPVLCLSITSTISSFLMLSSFLEEASKVE